MYAQLRYLHPLQQRWVNPSRHLASSPHLACIRLAEPPRRPALLIVTEGMTDALTAADAGYSAVALLGAGLADATMASTLVQRWPTQHLVIAFDAGSTGRRASSQLIKLLGEAGAARRASALELPEGVDDLNEWCRTADRGFRSELSQRLPRLGPVEQELGLRGPPADPARSLDRGMGLT